MGAMQIGKMLPLGQWKALMECYRIIVCHALADIGLIGQKIEGKCLKMGH
jgi:hypothetical protein